MFYRGGWDGCPRRWLDGCPRGWCDGCPRQPQKIRKIVVRKFEIFSSSLIFKEKMFFDGPLGFN